jgi:hypothetical protein
VNAGERAMSIFQANGGVLNTEKAIRLGIHPRTLYALRDSAKLDRMERGLYRLADAKPLGNPDFVTVELGPRLRGPFSRLEPRSVA